MQPEKVRQYPFIDKWRAKGFQYLVIPKAMLGFGKTLGISCDEAVLYALLRDRAKLSVKNNWVDDMGRIYLSYTRETAAKMLGCSMRKVIDVFAALVDHGLLEEKVMSGANKMKTTKRLYLKVWMEPTYKFTLKDIQALNFPFLTKANIDADIGSYYILPKVLLEDEVFSGLSPRAILLYVMALDKLHLSIMFEEVDENGLVWTTLDNTAVLTELGCSARSLTSAYKELETIGLMERRKVGYGGTIRIYLRDYLPIPQDPLASPSPSPENMTKSEANPLYAKSALHTRKICTTCSQDLHAESADSAPSQSQNLHPNQPYPSHPSSQPSLTNLSTDGLSVITDSATAEEAARKKKWIESDVKAWVNYEQLISDIQQCAPEKSKELWLTLANTTIELMVGDMVGSSSHLRIGTETYRRETLEAVYRETDCYTLYAMIDKIIPQLDRIKNLRLYVHKAVVTAKSKHGPSAIFYREEIERKRACSQSTHENDEMRRLVRKLQEYAHQGSNGQTGRWNKA